MGRILWIRSIVKKKAQFTEKERKIIHKYNGYLVEDNIKTDVKSVKKIRKVFVFKS